MNALTIITGTSLIQTTAHRKYFHASFQTLSSELIFDF